MVSELVAIVAVLAAAAGAAYSVWNNTPDGPTPISRSRLLKSISSAVLGAVALVNLTSLVIPDGATLTWTGFVLTQLFVGAGISKAFNHQS